MEFSAKQIAEYIQGVVVGDENATVQTFAKIEEGMPGAISFLANPKYAPYIYETQSSIVLVNKDFGPEKEIKTTLIKVDNAYESIAKLLTLYEMSKPKKNGINPLASIAASAQIGENVYVAPYAVIGEGVVIGDNTQIHANTVIGDHAFIGCNTNLVAPVKVGDWSYTAAGSTITEDVPENTLGIGRARQVNKVNWVLRKKPYKETE